MSATPTSPATHAIEIPGKRESSATTPPTLTISVVSHGQRQLVTNLLDDLRRLAPAVIARVLVTLNLPETPPDVSRFSFPVEFIRNRRPLGFAANHNQAFALARSEYFAVVNPDIRLRRDPFAILIDHLMARDVGIVSPVVLEPDGLVADFARPLVTPREVLQRRFVRRSSSWGLDRFEWLAGMFLVFRSETYRALGGFDAGFSLYCEDVDICARARLAGYRLEIAREVEVVHHARRASRRAIRALRLHVASLLRFWSSPVYHEYKGLLQRESALGDRAG